MRPKHRKSSFYAHRLPSNSNVPVLIMSNNPAGHKRSTSVSSERSQASFPEAMSVFTLFTIMRTISLLSAKSSEVAKYLKTSR